MLADEGELHGFAVWGRTAVGVGGVCGAGPFESHKKPRLGAVPDDPLLMRCEDCARRQTDTERATDRRIQAG